ncbi:MAG: hypothetical protein ACM33B_10705 [Pseudomonadota bacterium]
MSLDEELERIAAAAAEHAAPGEGVAAVLAAEPAGGRRVYLCAYGDGDVRTWLALDVEGVPVDDRGLVRDAASIAALCEVAVELAAGGDLEGLRSQLVALRIRESPPGIEDAEAAALELEQVIGAAPRIASPSFLDAVGEATLRLERALGDDGPSPFAEAMRSAVGAVNELADEIEREYKRPLDGARVQH